MKAVGARRRFVLQVLLTETGVIGLLGALAGTGLAMGATAVLDQSLLRISASFDWPRWSLTVWLPEDGFSLGSMQRQVLTRWASERRGRIVHPGRLYASALQEVQG